MVEYILVVAVVVAVVAGAVPKAVAGVRSWFGSSQKVVQAP